MANKKISELPAGGNFMNSNYFEGVEGGNNVRFTPDQVNPFRGTYAGGVAYPSSGGRYSGGAPAAGDQWVLTAELVVSGNVYSEGTILMSKVNNPGQTVSNWSAIAVQL